MDFIAMAEVLEAQAASLRRHAATIANEGQASLPLHDAEPAWIDWVGGDEPPVPTGTLVDIRFRDLPPELGRPADVYVWSHEDLDDGSEIVAYRVSAVQPGE